jgi:hypothetical protein
MIEVYQVTVYSDWRFKRFSRILFIVTEVSGGFLGCCVIWLNFLEVYWVTVWGSQGLLCYTVWGFSRFTGLLFGGSQGLLCYCSGVLKVYQSTVYSDRISSWLTRLQTIPNSDPRDWPNYWLNLLMFFLQFMSGQTKIRRLFSYISTPLPAKILFSHYLWYVSLIRHQS